MTPFQQKQLVLMRQMEIDLASGSTQTTIIPTQTNYAADNQLCLTVNTFLPTATAKKIQTLLIEPLKAIDPTQYYYPTESLHITFHSVRIIHDPPTYTAQDIKTSHELLTKCVPKQQAFPFILQGVMSLPTSTSVIALVTPEYDRFIRLLRQSFVNAGIPDDKTYYTQNVVFANSTICRYQHSPSQEFLKKLETFRDIFIGTFVAGDVVLLETNAVAHPSKTKVFGTYRFQNLHV